MISHIDSTVDKVDYYVVRENGDILATQALFVIEFSPYTVQITSINIITELPLKSYSKKEKSASESK